MRFGISICATLLALLPSVSSAKNQGYCFDACSPAAEVQLTFANTFTGTYRTGEPFDVVTIDPAGTSEALDDVGISLRVRLYCDCFGQDYGPLAGLPPDVILLFANSLHPAASWFASTATDAEGWTEFHATMTGGGCAQSLDLYADGMYVTTLHIQVNSPDATPTTYDGSCAVDAGDIAALAARLGNPAAYSMCFDWNEDGAVDAGDVAALSAVLGAQCD